MSEELKDKKDDELPKNAWELIWKVLTSSDDKIRGAAMVAALGAVTFNGEMREFAGALLDNQKVRAEKPTNWMVNHLTAAINAFVYTMVLAACLSVLTSAAASNIHQWETRWMTVSIVILLRVVLFGMAYQQVRDIFMRIGALGGLFKSEDVTKFKMEGGGSLISLFFSGSKAVVGGGLHGLWDLGRKMALVLQWVTLVDLYYMIIPLHQVPGLVWLTPPLAIAQIVLHVFYEQKDRGVVWWVINWLTLSIVAGMAAVATFPEIVVLLQMDRGSAASLITRLILSGLVAWLVYIFISKANAMHKSAATAAASTDAKALPAGTYHAVPPKPAKTGLSGASMLVRTALVLTIIAGVLVFNYLRGETDNFNKVAPIVSNGLVRLGWIDPMVKIRGVDGGGTSSATVQASTESLTNVATTFEIPAKPGDIWTTIDYQKGDTIIVKVHRGSYEFHGKPTTVDGTWSGSPATPKDFVQMFNAEDLYNQFVSVIDPIGVLYIRSGPGTPRMMVGTGGTFLASTSGKLSFLLNIPQIEGRTDLCTGTLYVEVEVRHVTNRA